MKLVKEPTNSEIKSLIDELSKCTTPYHIRNAINRDRYFLSNRCLKQIRKRLLFLMGKSMNPYDNDLYNEIFDEIDDKINQAKVKRDIHNAPKERKGKKTIIFVPYDVGDDGIKIEMQDDQGGNLIDAVNRHLFILAYNKFNGSSRKISKYLGASTRSISGWKKKYIKREKLH